MTAMQRLLQWQSQAKRRQYLLVALIGLPIIIAGYFLVSRIAQGPWPIILVFISIVLLGFKAWHSAEKMNQAWLIRQIDNRRIDLENSSDLLFTQSDNLSSLQQLQQQRVQQRVIKGAELDLRAALPWRIIFISLLLASAMTAIALYWPQSGLPTLHTSTAPDAQQSKPNAPIVLQKVQISIKAPSYTGLAVRNVSTLNIKAPENSQIEWQLIFSAQPKKVDIVFLDGKRIPLQADDGLWRAKFTLSKSSLYRVEVNALRLSADKLHRLEAIKDMPPVLRVTAPDRTLSMAEFAQDQWQINFEAEDDYGLGLAQMRVQLAQGSGENIKFKQSMQTLQGQGNRKQKRYVTTMNLRELGLAAGDDLIVQFIVNDQRTPKANTRLSSSYILRWPPEESTEASGVQGMLKKVAPAYFRSQRQIIIDTEKLIVDRNKISKDEFELRSDNIGVDQRLLRLRYGQFLGEETEGFGEDDHDSEPPVKQSATEELLSEYGHTHDIPEAATLLDPETKKLLRAALNEMWQAELHLRSVQPKLALPYENRALEFIKKVQQADRIYLARVGNELPPIDESRRLSGDRRNLSSATEQLFVATAQDTVLTKFWQALSQPYDVNAPVNLDFTALNAWINTHQDKLPDVLSLMSALDALQQKPQCNTCRADLRKQLWPLMPKPNALPNSRHTPTENGQRYLQLLNQGGKP